MVERIVYQIDCITKNNFKKSKRKQNKLSKKTYKNKVKPTKALLNKYL
jgi:hypothetical protein